MMNLKGIQQQQQQQSGTSMEGAYANTNNHHRGPSSASLDTATNEKFTDIIFMEEPAKVRILKNRNFFIERAKTNLDVLQSASLNDSNELIKRKLLKQQQQYETKQNNNNSFVNNCSPSSDHINSSSLDHNHHQNLRSRGADSSSSYFKFKPFQPLRFAPPTAALTAATAAAAAAAAAAVSSGEHLTNASNQVASPSLLKTAHNKSISPSPSSLAIHNLNSNSVDVIYNNQNNGFPVANSPINNINSSSMYLSKINYHHQEPPQPPTMTQYKFSKTLFGENNNNNHQSNSTTPQQQQHHNPRSMTNNNVLKRASNDNNSKSPSRNSLNQQHHESIFLNSSSSPLSIGGAVVNSNTNGVKRQLAGSNSLGRSLTMRYVRPQPPTYLIEPTTNGLQQPQQRSGSQNQQHLNYNNNNLGLNRRSSFYHQTLDNSSPKRTPISTNTTANNHTDLIASFSPSISGVGGNGSDHIKRSSSIKLLREKTSLSNYFSGLTNNNTSGSPTNNALTLNFLTSSSSNHNNNNNNSPSKLSTTAVKKGQPVSFRNNSTNINSLIRKHESNEAAKTNSISLENVMNGFELLLAADDLHSSKTIGNSIAANPPAGIKLVSNNNTNLLNRSKRSDEILVIESSPNNNNEQTIEIKELTKTNNRKSVEFGEQHEPITDLNDSAEIYNAKKAALANRQRFNLINNRPNLSNSLLKKTKSFMIADSNKLFGQEARNEAESKSILTTNSSSKNNNSPAQNGATTLKLVRSNSRLSHVTRDVNDSYAYTNVQQYIEENELMPPEKAYSIRKWIRHVNQMRDDWEKRTVEINIVDG